MASFRPFHSPRAVDRDVQAAHHSDEPLNRRADDRRTAMDELVIGDDRPSQRAQVALRAVGRDEAVEHLRGCWNVGSQLTP
jgi:hypothetical protein